MSCARRPGRRRRREAAGRLPRRSRRGSLDEGGEGRHVLDLLPLRHAGGEHQRLGVDAAVLQVGDDLLLAHGSDLMATDGHVPLLRSVHALLLGVAVGPTGQQARFDRSRFARRSSPRFRFERLRRRPHRAQADARAARDRCARRPTRFVRADDGKGEDVEILLHRGIGDAADDVGQADGSARARLRRPPRGRLRGRARGSSRAPRSFSVPSAFAADTARRMMRATGSKSPPRLGGRNRRHRLRAGRHLAAPPRHPWHRRHPGTVIAALVLALERVVDAPRHAGGADQRAGAEESPCGPIRKLVRARARLRPERPERARQHDRQHISRCCSTLGSSLQVIQYGRRHWRFHWKIRTIAIDSSIKRARA